MPAFGCGHSCETPCLSVRVGGACWRVHVLLPQRTPDDMQVELPSLGDCGLTNRAMQLFTVGTSRRCALSMETRAGVSLGVASESIDASGTHQKYSLSYGTGYIVPAGIALYQSNGVTQRALQRTGAVTDITALTVIQLPCTYYHCVDRA